MEVFYLVFKNHILSLYKNKGGTSALYVVRSAWRGQLLTKLFLEYDISE